jgi:hypothetical protein
VDFETEYLMQCQWTEDGHSWRMYIESFVLPPLSDLKDIAKIYKINKSFLRR